jgi:NTE family protein
MDITTALGGAKGNAHIGVLRRLEKEGFRIRAVAGTSYGGLVAAFYAMGYSPDRIEEIFAAADQTQFYGHAPEDGPSLVGVACISRLLENEVGNRTFADLKLPCALTAVDLKSGQEVLLTKGRLVDAMLATDRTARYFPCPPRRWARTCRWRDAGSRPGDTGSHACAQAAGGRRGVDDAYGRPGAALEHSV